MPHALTDWQREYLDYIRNYITENESSPRLEEIAAHFDVKAPTAHKMLEVLRNKGFIYFNRDSVSGFFIRVIERAGSSELVTEVVIAGGLDRYGELIHFPGNHGHFATILQGVKPDEIFALYVNADIPEANLLLGDLLICDMGRKPKPHELYIGPMGERLFLMEMCVEQYVRRANHLTRYGAGLSHPRRPETG